MTLDLILVDIFKEVVDSMKVKRDNSPLEPYYEIFYTVGKEIQILKMLSDRDNSEFLKNQKYPLFCLFLPIKEKRANVGWYSKATFPRIVIATITNGTDDVLERYKEEGTFKKILYPCYYEFLKRLSLHRNIIGSDPDDFIHTKMDNPGTQPIGQGLNDYVDCIEILDLELQFIQTKTC